MRKMMNVIVLGLMTLAAPVYAQSKGDKDTLTNKEKREARKQEKQQAKDEEMAVIKDMAENRAFVIDADFLLDRQSRQYLATANNFVSIEGERVVIQTASPYAVGYNGMGGVTFVGRILDYKVNEGKKGNAVYITTQVTSPALGNATLFITLNGRENAVARLYGTWGRSIAFSGNIEPIGKSPRYQGQNIPW